MKGRRRRDVPHSYMVSFLKALLVSSPVRVTTLLIALTCAFFAPSETSGQIFGERGIFGNKPEPPPRSLTEEEIGVPFPKTGRVQAVKGQEVRFEIEAVSKAPGAAVEFLIRTLPAAGKVISLVENPNARNRAIVTYLADPSSSAEADVFGFAVRYRGGRYSSEVRFDIDLVDVKAEIQSQKEVDFGNALIGEEVVQEVAVKNLGTGDFRRQIYLTPPWRIVEPVNGMLQIQPKQTRKVKVGFRPTMEGETSYFLSFSRSRSAMTKLIGKGAPPLKLETPEAQLTLDPGTGDRSGEVVVTNLTEKPLRLSLRGSSRIQKGLPEMVMIPSGEPYPIRVKIPAIDTAPFDGMLQIHQQSGYALSARLVSAVVPGKLEVSIPNSVATEVINFGRVGAGESAERGFRITNTGGVAVPLEFHIPEPYRLLSDPGPQLAPQTTVSLSVGIFPSRTRKGPVDVTMNVLGLDQSLPIRLLANLVRSDDGDKPEATQNEGVMGRLGHLRMSTARPSGPSVSVGNGGNPSAVTPPIGSMPEPAEVQTSQEPMQIEGLPGLDVFPLVVREINGSLRSPEDLSLVKSDAKSLTIGWTAPPQSELSTFSVELVGMMENEEGFPATVWVPIDGVEFERVDRLVKAKIDGLSPYSTYFLRVFTVDENGRSSQASEALEVATELPMDWTYIYLALIVMFISALGFGIWKILQNRRAEV